MEIGILLDQNEAEKKIKPLNLLFNNIFHKIGPIFATHHVGRKECGSERMRVGKNAGRAGALVGTQLSNQLTN